MEQIAACGAKLLCRVARVGPFVFARVVFENVRVSRSVLEDATDKISWLMVGGSTARNLYVTWLCSAFSSQQAFLDNFLLLQERLRNACIIG